MNSHVYDWARESDWLDIVEEPATDQAKEDSADRVRAGDVGAPATLERFASQKKMEQWHSWTTWQFASEQLGTSGLRQRAFIVVGE